MSVEQWLPPLTSGTILLSGLTLTAGWIAIKRRRRDIHHRLMIVATILAALFLILYGTRWYLLGTKPFEGEGVVRVLYFAILIPHTILAILVGPAALVAIWRARRHRFRQHRRIGRLLVPAWLFVAGSGWVIYWMLYQL